MPQGKNLVGTFYQPACVICDLGVLQSLPEREFLAGYAEVVKYGLINDPEFFIWLENHGRDVCERSPEYLARAIEVSCRKKAEIVRDDETEQDKRALLNLGHTFGHALEAAAGYSGRLLHGEAVSIGMVLAFQLSARLGLCDEADAARVETHLKDSGLPVAIRDISPSLKADADALMEYMKHDKKASAGKIAFVLARGIGRAYVDRSVSMDDVRRVLLHSMKG